MTNKKFRKKQNKAQDKLISNFFVSNKLEHSIINFINEEIHLYCNIDGLINDKIHSITNITDDKLYVYIDTQSKHLGIDYDKKTSTIISVIKSIVSECTSKLIERITDKLDHNIIIGGLHFDGNEIFIITRHFGFNGNKKLVDLCFNGMYKKCKNIKDIEDFIDYCNTDHSLDYLSRKKYNKLVRNFLIKEKQDYLLIQKTDNQDE